MLQCLLTQQTQQGAVPPCLGALAQLKNVYKKRCHVNEPGCFIVDRVGTDPQPC